MGLDGNLDGNMYWKSALVWRLEESRGILTGLDRNLDGNLDRSLERNLHRNLDGNPDKKLVQNLDENLQLFFFLSTTKLDQPSIQSWGSRVVGPPSIHQKAKLAKRNRVHLAIQYFLPQQA